MPPASQNVLNWDAPRRSPLGAATAQVRQSTLSRLTARKRNHFGRLQGSPVSPIVGATGPRAPEHPSLSGSGRFARDDHGRAGVSRPVEGSAMSWKGHFRMRCLRSHRSGSTRAGRGDRDFTGAGPTSHLDDGLFTQIRGGGRRGGGGGRPSRRPPRRHAPWRVACTAAGACTGAAPMPARIAAAHMAGALAAAPMAARIVGEPDEQGRSTAM